MSSPLSRIAVVTGASSGIGRASAVALARAGWTVVLSGRRSEQLQETIDLIQDGNDAKATMAPGDLTKPDEVKKLFSKVKERYGEDLKHSEPILGKLKLSTYSGRLDLLFNVRSFCAKGSNVGSLEVLNALHILECWHRIA